MRRLLVRLGGAAIDHPRWAVVAALLALVLVMPGVQRLNVNADLHRMIPERNETARGLALWVEAFARSNALYALLETADGHADRELLGEVGDALTAALESSSLVAAAKANPGEGLPSTDPLFALDLLDGDRLEELKSRTTPAGIADRAAGLKGLLSSPLDVDSRRMLLRDPFGLLELLGSQVAEGVQRLDSSGGGFLAPDDAALLLVLRPVEGEGRDFAVAVETEVQEIAARVLGAHPRGEELRFGATGSLLYARHIEDATRADAGLLTIVSLIAVLLLYLGFYRSIHSLGTMLLLLPYSAVLTLGLSGYLFDELTPLAAGFAAILFGLGVDPAIHLTSRYREALHTHERSDAAREAIRRVGPAVVIASLTSAAALQGMGAIGSKALGQMGRLAGMGVLVNAAAMLLVLPALWMLLGRLIPPDAGIGLSTARGFASFLQRRSHFVLAGASGVFVLLAALYAPIRFDASLQGFRPASLAPVRVDLALERHFGEQLGKLVVLVRGEDEEAVLRVNDGWADALEGLEARDLIAGYESMKVLKPSQRTVEGRRTVLRRDFDLRAASAGMAAALAAEGFRAEPFAPALERLAAFADGAEPAAASADPDWVAWFQEKHAAVVDGDYRVATNVAAPEGVQLPTLHGELTAAAPEQLEGVESYITGLPLVEHQARKVLEHGLPRLVAASLLILLLVLIVHYRNARIVAVGFVPLGGAVVLFLALFAAGGLPLSFFGMAAIPLLVGVGIDDHVFMLDRYLEDGRPGDLAATLSGAGRAIVVTTLTTLAGFGVLSLSRFDALASMGAAVALALAVAFCCSVVLLPALLVTFLPGEGRDDDSGGSVGSEPAA